MDNEMFGFLDKKAPFFSVEEQAKLVAAIRAMETKTSGEIRLYVESKNPFVEPVDRAAQVFFDLEMDETKERNAVLIYIAMKHREVAIFADEGIHQRLGKEYWAIEVVEMMQYFKEGQIVDGLLNCIHHIGTALQKEFPYVHAVDKNELPDDIVFGK